MSFVDTAQQLRGSRALTIGVFVTIGVALIGFAVGTSSTVAPYAPPQESASATIEVGAAPARRYSEMRVHQSAVAVPLASVEGDLNGTTGVGPDPSARFAATAEERESAVAERANLRAYDGAPPVIPHAVDQRSVSSCMGCHGAGAKVGQLVARRPSHGPLGSCTQCHTTIGSPVPGTELGGEIPGNTFEGLEAPTEGPRAWSIAPPQIPHTTWMRSECTSCHGSTGRQAIRTSHPWRTSCTQCHTPSAELDQWGRP